MSLLFSRWGRVTQITPNISVGRTVNSTFIVQYNFYVKKHFGITQSNI